MMVVTINDKEVKTFLKTLPQKLRLHINKGIQDWGKNYQESLKLASTAHFWSGELYQSIKWRKRGNGGFIEMSDEGVALDTMRPHWVALKRGRKITEWAQAKGLALSRGRGGGADVTIYPFQTRSIYDDQ